MTTEYFIIKAIIYILILTAGFTLGHLIIPPHGDPSGELVIDTSDPKKDRWLIKLDEPTEEAARRHIVILKVSHRRITEGDAIWPNENS